MAQTEAFIPALPGLSPMTTPSSASLSEPHHYEDSTVEVHFSHHYHPDEAKGWYHTHEENKISFYFFRFRFSQDSFRFLSSTAESALKSFLAGGVGGALGMSIIVHLDCNVSLNMQLLILCFFFFSWFSRSMKR